MTNKIEVIKEMKVLDKDFKIYGDTDNPLFLAKDVANWIEHNKPSEMIKNVDEDEKIKVLIDPSDTIAMVLQANTEYWLDIEGYEGKYKVSNYGFVKSMNYNNTKREKIMVGNIDKNGYKTVTLSNIKKRTFKVHRLVAQAFIANTESLETVNHLDENKQNNHYLNLEWCTVKDNINYGSGVQRSSNSRKGERNTIKGEGNPMYGRKHTEATKKAISKKNSGIYNKSSKKVQCNGDIFASVSDFCHHYGIPRGTVGGWLTGARSMPLEWLNKGLSYI